MSEALLTQRTVSLVIGATRLRRLVHAGWLVPVQRTPARVFYRVFDVHAALTQLERSVCPPDRIEVLRVRASELRNGHPRVRKEKVTPVLDLSAIELDLSGL